MRGLRVRVMRDVAVVTEGDLGAGVDQKVRAAVLEQLSRAGMAVVPESDDRPADVSLKLEVRARGAVYFVESDLAAGVEVNGTTIDVLRIETALYRDADFAERMAGALVTAYLRSAPLGDLAANRHPRKAAPRGATATNRPAKPPDGAAQIATRRTAQGTSYYNLARYKDALGEYEAAYLTIPEPALLYNIAQCHRKLGNRKEALGFYKSYLRTAPGASNRADVKRLVAELEVSAKGTSQP